MATNAPLDERYLDWLYSLVAPVTHRNPDRTYYKLLHRLYISPFRWFVPNDDNRVEDARELRFEFLNQDHGEIDSSWVDMDASILEVLIALARRCAFETTEAPDAWFWRFIENLGLRPFSDSKVNNNTLREIDRVSNNFVDRRYSPNGEGGLFPLGHAREDQRDVEIWYQMAAYLLENDHLL